MSADRMPRRVRAWYGLPGEIVIEGDCWHWVRAGPIPLPHPPVVNFFARQGLPREARLQFGYWHEFGHLQTLPLALAHVVWLWRRRSRGRSRGLWSRLARFLAFLVVHEAAWELASEGYVVAKGGREYRRLYQQHRHWVPVLFWGGVATIALLGTIFFSRGEKS
ncbi:MAG: hypothetical protein GXP39_01325 [Chloroflexi bacterium]|nr:hypothetical protein [Chloroflexota bacterium]